MSERNKERNKERKKERKKERNKIKKFEYFDIMNYESKYKN